MNFNPYRYFFLPVYLSLFFTALLKGESILYQLKSVVNSLEFHRTAVVCSVLSVPFLLHNVLTLFFFKAESEGTDLTVWQVEVGGPQAQNLCWL